MEDDDRARECRQLDLMIDRIDAFRSDRIAIGPVISDLEALHWELHSVDDIWVEEFREAWADLEIPYAVALDRGEPIPSIHDPTVASGVDRLEALVRRSRADLIE
jgi:hypothetical protein